MIVVERPSAALMRKVHELLGAGELCPASLRWPRLALLGYEVAYRAQPCARRLARISGEVPGSAPGGQITVSDSDDNILTMAISSADPLQSCARAFIATDVNDLGSWAGAARPAPAAFTHP
jgi:hypothetical protein